MKQWKERIAVKWAAFVLTIAFSVLCVGMALGVAYSASYNLYSQSFSDSSIVTSESVNELDRLSGYWRSDYENALVQQMDPDPMFYYQFSVDGVCVYENYDFSEEEDYRQTYYTETLYLDEMQEASGAEGGYLQDPKNPEVTFEIKYITNLSSPKWEQNSGYWLYRTFVPLGETGGIICGALFGMLAVFAFCIYLGTAGHKRNTDGIFLCGFDRIPTDLLLAGYALFFIVLFFSLDFIDNTICNSLQFSAQLAVYTLFGIVAEGVILRLIASIVVRIKKKTLLRNTIIWRVMKLLWRGACAVGRGLRAGYRTLPMLWKTVLGLVGLAFVILLCMILVQNGAGGFAVIIGVLVYAAFNIMVCMITLQLKKLRTAGEHLAAGDFAYKAPTKRLFWEFRKHAENLNSISQGMSIAVEQRMKSERMKTELITNVSHDIKTPLTSIVSYVDLLKKPHTAEEERNYLDVLDRQSKRMKKLMTDLVDASKASTGNLTVTLAPVHIGELLEQAVGEYENRFREMHLTPIVEIPQQDVFVQADGKLLWRVMDNLLENIVKYAQPHTRVYLRAEQTAQDILLSMKNISREMLNTDAEELMERFVRGDDSRNTEGSGLGLNIAKSLTELQGGTLTLTIDGDLFKAEIRFAKNN